ncbi:glutamate synthase, NADH/NADPH, small subunit [Thermodesulfobium narugense DSM 14796]|uniref:Glutamate synthase, NADH/NADPH, small subunit n=1 Tax=Thermodesulfobium narugense DSM 14796 TaxID=747365 RepID=M1E4U2_9BACT|nr:glutamate synthase subunit beta [Thermodesulfobium narugense]AEE13766.1 glutamate synthase, NADH/NADPH, small subunit [Thermodesulfobium narugense DSM 14796]
MGKIGAFLEQKRITPSERAPLERIKDFNEFKIPMSEEDIILQASRCMDCGIPFCHSGVLLGGMTAGCPLHNLIPEFNDLIYRRAWKEAYKRLIFTNNFPEFTGRVCPAPCEGSCTEGLNWESVTIKNNELAIIEKAFSEGFVEKRVVKRSGKRVAVVGSGPSGLACADTLNSYGHEVSVFERADRVGGLLMYGIPNMKLDKKVVMRRIDLMQEEGVRFFTNKEIGVDIYLKDLVKEFDAVVLCCGATKPRDLKVPGRELKGIYFAVDFLKSNTKCLLDSDYSNLISAKNKNVIIIGGGDTGTDCVATAIRHGCKDVIQIEILPEPPKVRSQNNPWPEWPKVLKVDYGQEERIALFGKDPRIYLTTVTSFEPKEDGVSLGWVNTIKVKWERDDRGNFIPKHVPCSEEKLKADMVLIAMGFLGPEDKVIKELSIEQDHRSNVKAQFGDFKTNVEKVFAAGDMRRGQSLVVWAIAEGRGVAKSVNEFLITK